MVLGKYDAGGISYITEAKKLRASYYNLDCWSELSKVLGEDDMWKINEKFLEMQTASKKTIVFSHDIYNPDYIFNPNRTKITSFGKDVDFISKLVREGKYKIVTGDPLYGGFQYAIAIS